MVRRGDRPPRFFQDFDVMPWVKGIAAISITFLAFYLYQGLSYSIERLDVTDADRLKEVYFGNDTWCVLCHTNAAKPLYRPFLSTARQLAPFGDVKFATIDCTARLPSGKSTMQRLGLNKNTKPVIFITSEGSKKPRQLFPRYTKTKEALIKELVLIATPTTAMVTDASSLFMGCTSHEFCLLVLKGKTFGSKEDKILTDLMRSYRGSGLKVAMLDSVLYETSLENSLPKRNNLMTTRILFFKNEGAHAASPSSSSKKQQQQQQLKTKLFFGDFSKRDLTVFVNDGFSGKLRFKKLNDEIHILKRVSSPPPSRPPSSSSSSSSSSPPPPLGPEEEARRRVENERAKREKMEKAREDLVAAAGEEEEEEGEEEGEEDKDVMDLDEL